MKTPGSVTDPDGNVLVEGEVCGPDQWRGFEVSDEVYVGRELGVIRQFILSGDQERALIYWPDDHCEQFNDIDKLSKENDMGMKARERNGTQTKSHMMGPGGCGESWPGGSTSWAGVNCSKCLLNHPDRVPVPDYLEHAACLLIHNSLAWAARNGNTVKKGDCSYCNGSSGGTICCVCAPVVFRDKYEGNVDVEEVCTGLLGIPQEWLTDFVSGFDADGPVGRYPTAYKHGRRMARKHHARAAA
jgi:hypothetical protein